MSSPRQPEGKGSGTARAKSATGRDTTGRATTSKSARYVALQGRGTLTIPADLRRILHLDQPGAMAELVVRDDGVLEVRPKVPVSAGQAWFWSERWQQMEREADEDVAAGRVTRYDDADGFLASLEAL